MKINKKDLLILSIPVISMILLKPVLPDKIPMQWGLDGKVNWYLDKKYSFILGLLPIIIYKSSKTKQACKY